MKKIVLIISSIVAVLLCALGIYSWYFKTKLHNIYEKFGTWETASSMPADSLHWIPFYWEADSIGNKWVEQAAMYVPVSIENLPLRLQCQFDIGSNLSLIYGNPLRTMMHFNPGLAKKIHSDKLMSQTMYYLSDLNLAIGSIPFHSRAVFIEQNFGEKFLSDSVLSDSSQHTIGTIGVDICRDKVLIIDYPHHRLCLAGSVPAAYQASLSPISLDGQGRPILSLDCKGKTYKVEFDCGSSMFPILASSKLSDQLSDAPAADTIHISSWGKTITMTGRPIKDSFTLAGHRFGNVEVYSAREKSEDNIPGGCDGITGNVLFLDKVLIIDFRNRKIGLQ